MTRKRAKLLLLAAAAAMAAMGVAAASASYPGEVFDFADVASVDWTLLEQAQVCCLYASTTSPLTRIFHLHVDSQKASTRIECAAICRTSGEDCDGVIYRASDRSCDLGEIKEGPMGPGAVVRVLKRGRGGVT